MKQIIREGRGKREPQTRSRTGNNNKGKFVEVGAIIMRPICDYFVISMDCWQLALQRQVSIKFWQNWEDFVGRMETAGGPDCGPRAVCWTLLA